MQRLSAEHESFPKIYRSFLMKEKFVIPQVDVETLQCQRAAGHAPTLIDVRSPSEYATGHISGALNIPLEQIESRLDDLGRGPLVVVCKAGQRARMAAALLEPCFEKVTVLDGGTDAWIRSGFPVVASVRARWSLERQVRFGAGLLILAGVALGFNLNLAWFYLAGFVGLGLTFAGLTDFCPMGILLARMPWNRGRSCSIPIKEPGAPSCCD